MRWLWLTLSVVLALALLPVTVHAESDVSLTVPILVEFPGVAPGQWLLYRDGTIWYAVNTATGQTISVSPSAGQPPGLYQFPGSPTVLLIPATISVVPPPPAGPIQVNLWHPGPVPPPVQPAVSGNGQPYHVNLWQPGEPLSGGNPGRDAPAGSSGPSAAPAAGDRLAGDSPHQ